MKLNKGDTLPVQLQPRLKKNIQLSSGNLARHIGRPYIPDVETPTQKTFVKPCVFGHKCLISSRVIFKHCSRDLIDYILIITRPPKIASCLGPPESRTYQRKKRRRHSREASANSVILIGLAPKGKVLFFPQLIPQV